jgi:hypothetical protein
VSIRWENTLSDGLAQFGTHVWMQTVDALADGAEVIIADAETRTPKESGHLAGTGKVDKGRGGKATVGLWFAGPYARWIHEHLHFKHPRGGEAKFLETAMLTKGAEALKVAGERLWRRG